MSAAPFVAVSCAVGVWAAAASLVAGARHVEDEAANAGIDASARRVERAAFDIVRATIIVDGRAAILRMTVSGKAGASRPAPTGRFAGSTVYAYLWPTILDPSAVGFEAKAGILAFAVTAHPDFDDTPLFDENGDGDRDNDGGTWHSHWLVLQPDDACGSGALKVVDIPKGAQPALPKTWPELPILVDSPGWAARLTEGIVEVRVPFDDIDVVGSARFDAVTAALRVDASLREPLLCVVDVFEIASGDLSLPGKVGR